MKKSIFLFLSLVIVLVGVGATLDKSEQEGSDVESILKDFEAAIASRDLDRIMSLFAEDCVVDDFAMGVMNQSKAEVKASLKESFHAFPDLRFTIKTQIISGSRVASEWAMTGTHTGSSPRGQATGKYISIPGAGFMEIQDGKIRRYRGYYNRVLLLKQLGMRLVPQP